MQLATCAITRSTTAFHPSAPNAPSQFDPRHCAFSLFLPAGDGSSRSAAVLVPGSIPCPAVGALAGGLGKRGCVGSRSQPPRARPGAQLAPALELQLPPADPWCVFQPPLGGERRGTGSRRGRGCGRAWSGAGDPESGPPGCTDPRSIAPRARGRGAATCSWPAAQLPSWDDKLTPAFGGRYPPGTEK